MAENQNKTVSVNPVLLQTAQAQVTSTDENIQDNSDYYLIVAVR